jgi:hypothetical protein
MAVRFSADEMRELARQGFGDAVPLLSTQPPAQRRDMFLQFANAYATQWTICPACASLAASYKQQDDDRPRPNSAYASPTPDVDGTAPQPLIAKPSFVSRLIAKHSQSIEKATTLAFVIGLLLLLINGPAIWNAISAPVRWWWQSHGAMAQAEEKARTKDWIAARDILRSALAQYPNNPRLIRRSANVELLLGRPDLAGFHYRAFTSIPGVDKAAHDKANEAADRIAKSLRDRARQIYEEVYRLYDAAPAQWRRPDGPPFQRLEALYSPPVTVSAQLAPFYTRDSHDTRQAICAGLTDSCRWSFKGSSRQTIMSQRRIEIAYPAGREPSPCCALSLDDPDLADPAAALRRIAQLPPSHQLRAMFGLASKLAFVANMIAFN